MAAEDQALAAFGLVRDEAPPDDACPVWPENWAAALAFAAMVTQWNVGMNGPVGLRYEVLPLVLRLRGVPRAQWAEVFDGLRIMEAEALAIFAERRRG